MKFGEAIMSKLMYDDSASYSSCVMPKSGLKMYSVESIRPDSSAPHHAKRSVFCGASFVLFARSNATVGIAAEPLPSSWTPGPAGTLSRWGPAMTTLSGLTPGRSAMTFSVAWTEPSVAAESATSVAAALTPA